MVFKRYIKRGDRVYGPYYYESYRDKDGVVQKKYVGMDDHSSGVTKSFLAPNPKPKKNMVRFLGVVIVLIFIALLLSQNIFSGDFSSDDSSFSLPSFSSAITGFVSKEIYESASDSDDEEKSIRLEISNDPLFTTQAVGKGNGRMDFISDQGNIHLYFDLLDYDEFVIAAGEELIEQGIIEKEAEVVESVEVVEVVPEEIVEESQAVTDTEEVVESGEPVDDSEKSVDGSSESKTVSPEEKKSAVQEDQGNQEDASSKKLKEAGNFASSVIDVNESKSETNKVKNSSKNRRSAVTGDSSLGFVTGNVIAQESQAQESEAQESQAVVATDEPQKKPRLTRSFAEKVHENIGELAVEKVEDVAVDATIIADDFSVVVDESGAVAKEVDYKWGYNVRLDDYKFISKITISSDQEIVVVDDTSVLVGNSFLNFEDLVAVGYSVRIEKPSFPFANEDLDEVAEIIPEEIIPEEIIPEEVIPEDEIVEEEVAENPEEVETIPEEEIIEEEVAENPGEQPEVIPEEVIPEETPEIIPDEETEGNPEEQPEVIPGEEVAIIPEEQPEITPEETDSSEDETHEDAGSADISEESPTDSSSFSESSDSSADVSSTESSDTSSDSSSSDSGASESGASEGSVASYGINRFIKGVLDFMGNFSATFTGNTVSALSVDEYPNSISIYVERDFTGTDYQLGDILYLDPTLVIVNITDVSVNTDLVRVRAENNFTHLTISDRAPYKQS